MKPWRYRQGFFMLKLCMRISVIKYQHWIIFPADHTDFADDIDKTKSSL